MVWIVYPDRRGSGRYGPAVHASVTAGKTLCGRNCLWWVVDNIGGYDFLPSDRVNCKICSRRLAEMFSYSWGEDGNVVEVKNENCKSYTT